jgi:hypothetical protein
METVENSLDGGVAGFFKKVGVGCAVHCPPIVNSRLLQRCIKEKRTPSMERTLWEA